MSELTYAFGHLVSGFANPDDAHSADSIDLGFDTLFAKGYDAQTIAIITDLAEHVAGDYEYTGKATALYNLIDMGEF